MRRLRGGSTTAASEALPLPYTSATTTMSSSSGRPSLPGASGSAAREQGEPADDRARLFELLTAGGARAEVLAERVARLARQRAVEVRRESLLRFLTVHHKSRCQMSDVGCWMLVSD